MASKSSYERTRKKPGRKIVDDNEEELIVKCKNESLLNKVILIIFDFELDAHFIIAAIVAAMI